MVDGRTLATFVLGSGRGGVPRALAEGLRHTDAPTVVVVVETDPARMLATLVADDWAAAIADARIRFAIGPDLSTAILAAVPEWREPLLERGLNPGVGLVPGDDAGHSTEVRRAFDTAAALAMADFKRRCDDQARRHPRADGPPRLPSGHWRIHTSVSTATTAIRHLAPSILGAAAKAGHVTSVQLAETTSDPFLNSGSALASFESEPDLVLGFLRPGGTVIPWRQDFPSLVLVSSNPKLLPIETFAWSDRDLVVVTDPDFADAYRPLGVEPLVRPLATDLPATDALDAIETVPCDVVAVGNIPAAATILPDLSENLRSLIEEMAEDWVRHPAATIEQVLATTTITGDETFMTGIRLALGYEATRRRRIGAVIALADAGLAVRVHGDEAWLDALAGTAAEGCWHGWLNGRLEQSAAFRHAGVAINVNSFATPNMLNMRSFDVPAAGGVLVTDDRPALHASFEVGREALAFTMLDELPDLVSDVLRDRDRRDAIANAGRARVERDHSWDAWWAWAEARLRERFGGRE